MNKFGSKQIIPLAFAALAVLWIATGLSYYGFWTDAIGPTPGFVPIIIAVIMFLVSMLSFAQSFKEEKPDYPKANWLVILAGFSIFALTFLIGMLPTLAVYTLVWLKGYEKCSWKSTLLVFAVIMAIVVGVFVLWLGVPFPKGLVFDALLA